MNNSLHTLMRIIFATQIESDNYKIVLLIELESVTKMAEVWTFNKETKFRFSFSLHFLLVLNFAEIMYFGSDTYSQRSQHLHRCCFRKWEFEVFALW